MVSFVREIDHFELFHETPATPVYQSGLALQYEFSAFQAAHSSKQTTNDGTTRFLTSSKLHLRMPGHLNSSLPSSRAHLTGTALAPLSINTIKAVTPRRKRYLAEGPEVDAMGLPAGSNKRSRHEKSSSDENPKSRPAKVPKRLRTITRLNEAPSQRLDVYVFGSGESGELGLGHLKRNGKAPTNVKRPRLNDLLDAETMGIVQLDVGGMREFPLLNLAIIFCVPSPCPTMNLYINFSG